MKKQTIAKDTPLAELTLRKYEKPENLSERDLVRKLCLSLGLLQPGDSRDIIVDILYILITSKKELTSEEIETLVIQQRKKANLKLLGITPPNIRRQLKRLKDSFLIENIKNNYRITENLPLTEIFEEKLEKFLLTSIISRIKDYTEKIDEKFKS